MADKLFVFDLDDTLLWNKHAYSKPIMDFVQYVLDKLGNKAPTVAEIVKLENDIDAARVKAIDPTTGKPYLYNRRRFPTSFVVTYDKICETAGIPVEDYQRERLLYIGEQAFTKERYIKNIHPKASTVLSFLRDQGDILGICTKGDREIQEDKLDALKSAGLLKYFHFTLIVDNKNSDTFRDIMIALDKTLTFFTVGNMYRSDISPALEVGYRGVYIPDEHWESAGDREKSLALAKSDLRCLVLDDLKQLMFEYDKL